MDNIFAPKKKLSSSFFGSFIAQVYSWMTLGLFITSVVAIGVLFVIERAPQFGRLILTLLPIIFLLELGVVLIFTFAWRKFNAFISLGMFLLYALLNGFFFGAIMTAYTLDSIAVAFGATFITFLVMSLYGIATKSDLTKLRSLALMALLGLIIATIINFIISSFNPSLGNGLYWILNYVGLGIFIILVAADTQKLKMLAAEAEAQGGNTFAYPIQGALILYLDFINLFIRILSIMGKRK